MTYVPHFPCTIRLGEPNTVFAQSAADNLVNTTFKFCGVEVVVKKAWVDEGDLMVAVDNAIDEPWDEITAKYWKEIKAGTMTIREAYAKEGIDTQTGDPI